MKKYLLILLIISISQLAKPQATFFNTYSVAPYSGSGTIGDVGYAGLLTKASDGNYIGVTGANGGYNKIFFKVDPVTGNMLWRNEATITDALSTENICSLSDNTIAILFFSFSSSYTGVVCKMDLSGNIIWTKGLNIGNSASFSSMVPTTDGGVVISGGGCNGSDMIIHLNAQGNIVSQKAHFGTQNGFIIYNNDMCDDGNNQYSCWGYRFISGNQNGFPFAFYQTDSSGNINTVSVYDCNGLGANTWSSGNKLLCRSTGHGHYAIQPVNQQGISSHKMFLFYFNSANVRQWTKLIDVASDSAASPITITASADNGCVVGIQRMYDLSAHSSPAFIKFDSTGNMVWSKCAGDINNNHWRYFSIGSMINENGGFGIFVNHVFGIDICKTDAQLNGFCNYQSFNPVISTITPTLTTDNMSSFNINFQTVPITWTLTPQTINVFTECSTNDVHEIERPKIYISPNPANDFINISSTISGQIELQIVDITGTLVFETQNPGSNYTINTSSLSNGMYFIQYFSNGNLIETQKIIITE